MPKFPNKLVLHYPDGTTKEIPFKEPKASAAGRLNAHAGGKLVAGDDKYQIGCNVTLCMSKEKKDE